MPLDFLKKNRDFRVVPEISLKNWKITFPSSFHNFFIFKANVVASHTSFDVGFLMEVIKIFYAYYLAELE